MRFVGAADRVGACFAEAEVAHLALFDQARHRTHRVLNRHIGVDAMDVVKVDHVDADPLEAGLAGNRHVIRSAVDATTLAAGSADIAEL